MTVTKNNQSDEDNKGYDEIAVEDIPIIKRPIKMRKRGTIIEEDPIDNSPNFKKKNKAICLCPAQDSNNHDIVWELDNNS